MQLRGGLIVLGNQCCVDPAVCTHQSVFAVQVSLSPGKLPLSTVTAAELSASRNDLGTPVC